jgi:hypothetical protein
MWKQLSLGGAVAVMAACAGGHKAVAPAPVAAIAPTPPSVSIGMISASGKSDEVTRDLTARIADLQKCYEARRPEAAGTVTVWLRVDRGGSVPEANATGDDLVAPCFENVIRTTKFALDGADVAAQITFKLEPGTGAPAPLGSVGRK